MGENAMAVNLETSVTLGYRNLWGIASIVRDALSNHLPADSEGTTVTVRALQGGSEVGLKGINPNAGVEQVVFEDNGKGYDPGLLGVLFSTKNPSGANVGQFGEGLKLIAAAALRAGVQLAFESRDWRAVPYKKREVIDGNAIDRLCFKVERADQPIAGSRTVFTSPSKDLLEEIMKIPDNFLLFNKNYTTHYTEPSTASSTASSTAYPSRIIEVTDQEPSLFVKGRRVQQLPSIYSYDLGMGGITPDRLFVDENEMLRLVSKLLVGCTNPTVINTVLQAAAIEKQGMRTEFRALGNGEADRREKVFKLNHHEIDSRHPFFKNALSPLEYPSLISELYPTKPGGQWLEAFMQLYAKPGGQWLEAFMQLYGDNAVIAASDSDASDFNKEALLMGFQPVALNYNVAQFLAGLGAERADDIVKREPKIYKLVSMAGLSPIEKAILGMVPQINAMLPPGARECKDPEVRVYEGMFRPSGTEIASLNGVFVKEADGTEWVGIKRSVLGKGIEPFLQVYIEEIAHQRTGAADYTRELANYFRDAMAAMMLAQGLAGEFQSRLMGMVRQHLGESNPPQAPL